MDTIKGLHAMKILLFIDCTLRLEDALPFGLVGIRHYKLKRLIAIGPALVPRFKSPDGNRFLISRWLVVRGKRTAALSLSLLHRCQKNSTRSSKPLLMNLAS